jgi:Kef-type K+ transport system membrane component KefB
LLRFLVGFSKNWSALSNWEIIAGIVLGPSLLGLYFPNFQEFVSCGILGKFEITGQIGLILLCLYRMELDLKFCKANERSD